MSRESLLFDPARLRLARLAKGYRKNQLAVMVEVTPAAISQYENGYTRPGRHTLTRLALALGVPVGFFGLSRPLGGLERSAAHFRSLRATTQRERDQALAHAALTWDVCQVLEQRVRLPVRDVPSIEVDAKAGRADVERVASLIRSGWELSDGPVGQVVRLLEAHGTTVTRLGLGTKRVDAFCCDFGPRAVVVLADDKHDKARSRMDAAHELGHLVMHLDLVQGAPNAEAQAKNFAAAFLLPADQIAEELPRRVNWNQLAELSKTWGVSIKALLYRARTLGVIAETAFRRAMATMSSRGWNLQEPVDLGPAEAPALLHRALELLGERGYSIDDLAAEVQLPLDVVDAIVGLGDQPLSMTPLESTGREGVYDEG